jgi:DGQHR domain-containing protein
MQKISSYCTFPGIIGRCGSLDVFLGFASSRILYSLSFADILDEDTGDGYQRPSNKSHSLDFKKYIKKEGSSTIPLAFNLRKEIENAWRIERGKDGTAILYIENNYRCLAQVDCQHRLGELQDEDISLAFMTFIGLDLRQEMALFFIINSKARGLSSSLTDYHESNLLGDLAVEAPHLYISRKLNEDPASPWFKLIRYGGETTSGLKRRTSLRMMQKAILRFLNQTKGVDLGDLNNKYLIVRDFWEAVQFVFSKEWNDHRHHLITKGVGLHSLIRLLADFLLTDKNCSTSTEYLKNKLFPLLGKIDWSSNGMFAHAGGQKGVQEVHLTLRRALGL